MISPYFLSLPVFSNFNFIFNLILILKVFFSSWHTFSIAIRVIKYVLTFGDKLMTFVLPQYCSSVIPSACKERANAIPSDTVNRLLMVAQLSQLANRFKLFFFKQALHQLNILIILFANVWVSFLKICGSRLLLLKLSQQNDFTKKYQL